VPDGCIEDEGGLSSEFIYVDSVPDDVDVIPQVLWVGVRPGYDTAASKQLSEPTIWVQYQERYMAGPLTGYLALSPAAWHELNRTVNARLRAWRWLRVRRWLRSRW
jgi:hypothetical protein